MESKRKARVATLTSDKIDFKTENIIMDKEGHYIMIKGSIQEDDLTIVNIYAPNVGAPQYITQPLTSIRGEIDSNTIIVVDFNTPLTPMDRALKQRIYKETQNLSETLDQMDVIDYLQDFPPTCRIIHFLKCTWNILQDRPHLGQSNQASVNLRKLKSYQVSSLTTTL